MKKQPTLAQIRKAVALYMSSEGCSCCRGHDHGQHKVALAKLLRVPEYDDKSGFDFPRFARAK